MNSRLLLLATLFAAPAQAQTVLNYWDFSSLDDSVGGVTGNAMGTPDMSVHGTYGEAYPGSGPSLNTVIQALSAGVGGGALEATVLTGAVTAMDFGTSDFAFSYWVYDDSSDGDLRGPRPFDFLDGTTTGVQVVGNATGSVIMRLDDDAGNADILSPPGFPLADQWLHIVANVDRTNAQLVVYVNGVALAPIAMTLTGNIEPTVDMLIGAVNFGMSAGEAQNQGLDDLAFYDGLLSDQDALNLATAAKTPLDFVPFGTSYCSSSANSTGAASHISAAGSTSLADEDLTFSASDIPLAQFGVFYFGPTQISVPFGNGTRCIAGSAGAPTFRLSPILTEAGGSLTFATDFAAQGGNLALVQSDAGSVNFQCWYRDPNGGGSLFNLSDALNLTLVP